MVNKRRTGILLTLLCGTFLSSMTVTITSIMLPAIMKDLQVEAATAQWLTSGATLVSGIMVPLAAFLIKRVPSKTYFLSAIAVFTTGTFLAAAAPGFPLLLLGRLLQAAGCGVLLPFSQIVLMTVYPKEKHGSVMALYSLGALVAPVIAPTMAGLFIDTVGWKAVFLVIGVLGLMVLGLALGCMHNVTQLYPADLPVLDTLLCAAGFAGMLVGMGNGSIWLFGPGAVCLALFVWRQLHRKKILLDLRVFRFPSFRHSVLLGVLMYIICMGSGTLLPLFAQTYRGYTASAYAMATLPGSVLMAASTLLAGRLYDKVGPGPVLVAGTVALLTGSGFGFFLRADTGLVWIGLLSAFVSVGSGLLSSSLTTFSLSRLSGRDRVDGSAIFSTLRQIASSFASTLAVTAHTMLQLHTDGAASFAGIYRGYIAVAVLAIAVALWSLRKKEK